MPFLLPPSVLCELHGAIDFNGKFMRNSTSEFSEGSFKVIKIYGKLLRFNDILESQHRAASNIRLYIGQVNASCEYLSIEHCQHTVICYITTLFWGQHLHMMLPQHWIRGSNC